MNSIITIIAIIAIGVGITLLVSGFILINFRFISRNECDSFTKSQFMFFYVIEDFIKNFTSEKQESKVAMVMILSGAISTIVAAYILYHY